MTAPPPQQARRVVENDSPQHPQRRWCSPDGSPFTSVRKKIEVPRICDMYCLVLVEVSLFDETKVCTIIRINIRVHTRVQVHLHTRAIRICTHCIYNVDICSWPPWPWIWGVPHRRQVTRAGTIDASVPARDALLQPASPHTKSPLIMRDIYFAYRRYDKGIYPARLIFGCPYKCQ